MGVERRRGPCSKQVRNLLSSLCFQNSSDDNFKRGIEVLLKDYSPHNIALAIRGWVVEYHKENDIERILCLADAVDHKTRAAWEKRFVAY